MQMRSGPRRSARARWVNWSGGWRYWSPDLDAPWASQLLPALPLAALDQYLAATTRFRRSKGLDRHRFWVGPRLADVSGQRLESAGGVLQDSRWSP
jgi:hypothetical protein